MIKQIQSDGRFAVRNGRVHTANEVTYLWSEDIEVSSPIGAAD